MSTKPPKKTPAYDREAEELFEAPLEEVFDVFDALGAELALPAPAGLRDALLNAPLHGRLHRFAAQLAELMDVTEAQGRALLDGLDADDAYEPGPFPGMDIMLRHIDGGQAVANAITGFVRVAPGLTFPEHEHLGVEQVLILQGHMRDEVTGEVAGPGEVVMRTAQTSHAISALPGGTDLVYLAVVQEGVRIGDVVMGAGSPEL